MNEDKLGKLFTAVRKENPPMPVAGFDFLVMQAIRCEPVPRSATVSDQLNALFPRVAGAAVAAIALCIAGDWLDASAQTSLTDGVTQLSQQWLLTGDGL
jgi:hypothetical protein